MYYIEVLSKYSTAQFSKNGVRMIYTHVARPIIFIYIMTFITTSRTVMQPDVLVGYYFKLKDMPTPKKAI